MKCGVVVFPGSNCDHDAYHVLRHVLGQDVSYLWHEDANLHGCDFVILPGGWSFGDYLRGGALAAVSPVMATVKEYASRGGLVLGICNGFQVLTESGLLPGTLRRNQHRRFECRDVFLRVERNDLAFTSGYGVGQVLRLPIAHGEGNYTDFEHALDDLECAKGVVFRYVDARGREDSSWNFNGSARAIAGICNANGNVLGLMPHPERHAEAVLGCDDGLEIFAAAIRGVAAGIGVSR